MSSQGNLKKEPSNEINRKNIKGQSNPPVTGLKRKSPKSSSHKVHFSKPSHTSDKENKAPADERVSSPIKESIKSPQPVKVTELLLQDTDSEDDSIVQLPEDGSKLCAVKERKSSEESDCVIIEVQAVDMESDSDLSDKADDIIFQVLDTPKPVEEHTQ